MFHFVNDMQYSVHCLRGSNGVHLVRAVIMFFLTLGDKLAIVNSPGLLTVTLSSVRTQPVTAWTFALITTLDVSTYLTASTVIGRTFIDI